MGEAERLAALSEAEQHTISIPGPAVERADAAPAEDLEAAGAGLAGSMRARLARISADRTREFAVPGWEGDLVLRARFMDRADWEAAQRHGASDEGLILSATDALLMREGAGGNPVEIPGAFGPELARRLGMPADTPPTRLVAAVMDDRGPWITRLAADLMAWLMGSRSVMEGLLGE